MYRKAVPILLRHLDRDYCDRARSAIAEMLDGRDAEVRRSWPKLLQHYKKAREGIGITIPGDTDRRQFFEKHSLANVLATSATSSILGEMMELIADTENGETRLLLLQAFRRRRKSPEVEQFLEKMMHDPILATEISAWKPKVRCANDSHSNG